MLPTGCSLDNFCCYCFEQSRESWRASQRQLVSCLGERTEPQLQHTQIPISSRIEDTQTTRNMIALTTRLEMVDCGNQRDLECFQDLSWCPNAQDELNTPQVNLQDGFNFSTGCYEVKYVPPSLEDVMDESWGNDLLFNIKNDIDDDVNNNNNGQDPNTRLPEINYEYSVPSIKSPLKSSEKGRIMLSQASLDKSELSPSDISATAAIAPSSIFNLNPTSVNTKNTFRTPSLSEKVTAGGRREKPKLKLDISAASSSKFNSLSTPEVLKPLVDSTRGGGFDLVSYLDSENCGNGLEDDSEMVVPAREVTAQDHDYDNSVRVIAPVEVAPVIKSEPLSPSPVTIATSNFSRCRPIKRKTSDSQSDYVFDEDTGISDDSMDWSPSSSSSRNKRGRSKKAKIQAAKSPSSICSDRRSSRRESDADSVLSTTDRYRELRDKNNEASRRSRMNRKQRDSEMKRTAMDLERENIALKIKAERMENLVQELRATILKTLSNSRRRQNS